MKKWLILAVCSLVSVGALASDDWYDFSGAKKGAVLETCYKDPCSVSKVLENKILLDDPENDLVLIKLKLLGGSKAWDSKKTKWNRQAHDVLIGCSQKSPSIKTADEAITILPFNKEYGIDGVLMSDAELYMKTCHNFDGDNVEFANFYEYDVTDYSQ